MIFGGKYSKVLINFFLVELCVCYHYLLISWMKKLKFDNFFIINQILSNFPTHWKTCSACKMYVKYNKIYAHIFLFQEFVKIPLNWLNSKLLTIDKRRHKEYISSEWRFPNKTVSFQNYFIILQKYYQFLPKQNNKTHPENEKNIN